MSPVRDGGGFFVQRLKYQMLYIMVVWPLVIKLFSGRK